MQHALAEVGGTVVPPTPLLTVNTVTAPATKTVIRNTGNGVCSQVHAYLNAHPNATKKNAQAALAHINPITVGVQYGKWLKARKSA